ncbi:MAG: TlpA disulfide reductase family protein, partial [Flavobacteriales bacterium]
FRRFKYSSVFSEGELLFVRPLESAIPLVFSIGKESTIKFKTELPDIHTNLKVKGNNETSVASEFYNRMSQFKYRITETEQKLYTEETADGMYFYDSVLAEIIKEEAAFKMEFVEENKNTSSLMLMNDFVDYENDYVLMIELEKGLGGSLKETSMYKKVRAKLHKYQLFQEKMEGKGKKAPMLILPGVDGIDLSLSDFQGNFILLDFWASWCAPCRAEHPRLVKLYEEYQKRGFEIYSISLDKDKEKWLKAIAKDKLSWQAHASNLKMFECPSVKLYEVQALPFNVLIDREGYVLEVNLRGKKLEEKLKQIFDANN